MKISFFILAFLVLTTVESVCQNISGKKSGKDLFLIGSKSLENGNYHEADSLLSLALCSYKNESVYFNRGISRLYKTDTIGFCEDMKTASNKYYDSEARQLFNRTCCNKVDTIYYDRKFNLSDKNRYKYLEEIQYIRKTSQKIGTIHEHNRRNEVASVDYGCEKSIIGLSRRTTDIIALYTLIDTTKYYSLTTELPSVYDIETYQKLNDKCKLYFSEKYKSLKKTNDNEELSIYFEIKISKIGKIIDGKLLGIIPVIAINSFKDELEKDIKDIVKIYPNFKPAKFFGKEVDFITYGKIDF